MATIQIRDVPDDVHELLVALAQEAGQSLQAYMRQQVVDLARARSRKASALAELEEFLERDGGTGTTVDQILADLDADRR
jgi:antitoxin FitA